MEAGEKVFALDVGLHGQELQSCIGNACKYLTMTPNFWPGTLELRSVIASNSGPKTINVDITWGTALGGCGSGSQQSVPPNATVEIYTPSRLILGYCKVVANS